MCDKSLNSDGYNSAIGFLCQVESNLEREALENPTVSDSRFDVFYFDFRLFLTPIMSTESLDHASHIKSLINDLDDRISDLKHFDANSEINFHCDDLIGQVMLTIESAMEHLNKVQTRMVNEVNKYRTDLLNASDLAKSGAKQSPVQERFQTLSAEMSEFKTKALASVDGNFTKEATQTAENMRERTNDLRRQMRVEAFGGLFLRLVESDFIESDIIGSLKKTQKDVQDDFGKQHWISSPFF